MLKFFILWAEGIAAVWLAYTGERLNTDSMQDYEGGRKRWQLAAMFAVAFAFTALLL